MSRAERQAVILLRALHSIYVALGSFAGATLVTLLAQGLTTLLGELWFRAMAGVGLVLGIAGVAGPVLGSARLFTATRMSLDNIRGEAALIRQRQFSRGAAAPRTDELRDEEGSGRVH